jgi:uncharacterized protein
MKTMTSHSNHLANESSPYLLQHATNPVDWYPWNTAALEAARRLDRPILLSIGYSACHWCHVMAHESFEDLATAEVMNRLFVNIKVDREERPDLDKIYQSAHQLLNQRGGGWPLTVFLTPDDHSPFFAGTYFPPEPRHGMPAFRDVLEQIEAFFRENRDEIRQQNHRLIAALDSLNPAGGTSAVELDALPLDAARQQLAQSYDPRWGGFGQAPKFPHPGNLNRLLRHWAMTRDGGHPDQEAFDIAITTLHAMAAGGIYDQLGGGFCRYSVDEKWMIPHFEKMLYDNGPLLELYSAAWQITGNAALGRVARETGEWVRREMQSPEGGYYATLDADSEGAEGRFYVWTPDEVQALLSDAEFKVVSRVYGLDRPANFEGHWHLHVYADTTQIAEPLQLSANEAHHLLQSARQKLFAAREQRTRPGRDEKILTAWNGLMIKGMAAAGRRLNEPVFIRSAQQAVEFIRSHLFVDGRLLASYKDGHARLMAYLDDYVFLIDGLLELLQAEWRSADLEFACQLAEIVLAHFEDRDNGGFYYTADDHERLIHRPKPVMDEAIPAGNGIAVQVLGRLGHLLGENRYLDAAERTLHSAWPAMQAIPYAHGSLLDGLEDYLYPPEIIILRGEADAMQPWLQTCQEDYAPRRLCLAIPSSEEDLPGSLAQRKAPDAGVIAYRCTGTRCLPPITRREDLALKEQETGSDAQGKP